MTKKILIFGVGGMLGNACFEYFKGKPEYDVHGTWRESQSESILSFDVLTDSVSDLIFEIKPDWIINCIGVIKQKIDDLDQKALDRVMKVNAEFPLKIAKEISGTNTRVIQIATDCVFNGESGSYSELSPHNAIDVYGRSKSLGEIPSMEFMHLRVSIIGREAGTNYSLVDWFLSRPQNAEIDGYANHKWNGITTIAFAKIAGGIIQNDCFKSGTINVTPKDQVSKYELLWLLRKYFNRLDIVINPIDTPKKVDRTLETHYPQMIEKFWSDAGYETTPTIEELVSELANQH